MENVKLWMAFCITKQCKQKTGLSFNQKYMRRNLSLDMKMITKVQFSIRCIQRQPRKQQCMKLGGVLH